MLQRPKMERILPFTVASDRKTTDISRYLLEPDQSRLLAYLLPKLLQFRIYFAMLESATGEHGARMTSMDNATNNTDKLISLFTLERNRARQASITRELIEIISGAEAL